MDRKRGRDVKALKERKRTKLDGSQLTGKDESGDSNNESGDSQFFSDALMPIFWEHLFVNIENGVKVPLNATIYNKTSWRHSKYLNQDGTIDKDRWIEAVDFILDNNPCFEKKAGVKNLNPTYVKYSLMLAEGYEDPDNFPGQVPVNNEMRNNFDFLIVTSRGTSNEEIVCSLLIAQRGECTESPGSWVVRIICNSAVLYPPAFWMPDEAYTELQLTKEGEKRKYLDDGFSENWLDQRENRPIVEQNLCLKTGLHIMGAFVYAAKNWNSGPDSSTALLELANGYENVLGYCLYDKFGFVRTGHIDEKKCSAFATKNIEMRLDLDSISYAELVATVQTTKKMRVVNGQMVEVPKDVFCLLANQPSMQDQFRGFNNSILDLNQRVKATTPQAPAPPRSTRGNPMGAKQVSTKKTTYMIALENLIEEKRKFDEYMNAALEGIQRKYTSP